MALAKQLNEVAYLLKFLEMGWHLMPFDFKRVQLLCESVLPLLRACISDVDTLASLEEDAGDRLKVKKAKLKPPSPKGKTPSMADKVRDLLLPGNPPYQGTKQQLAEEVGYTHQAALTNVKHFPELWEANQSRLAADADVRRQLRKRPS